MEPEEWIREAILAYRDLAEDLTRAEEGAISIWDFAPPCQVTDYWFEPTNHHHLVLTHFDDEPDREIRVVGPLETYGLFSELEEDLERDGWDRRLPLKSESPLAGTWSVEEPPTTYYEAHRRKLVEFCRSIDIGMYTPRDRLRQAEVGGGTAADGGMSYIDVFGPLEKLDPREAVGVEVRSSVSSYRQSRQPRRRPPTPPTPPPEGAPREEEWDGWWTWLYPPATVGERPKRSLAQEAFGRRRGPFQRTRETLSSLGREFLYSYDGFVGVLEAERRQALRRLNCLSFLLDVLGYESYFLHAEDCAGFVEREDDESRTRFKSLTWLNSTRGHAAEKRLEEAAEPHTWPPNGLRSTIRQEAFEGVLRSASSLEGRGVSDRLLLLHQAGTLHREGIYSPALLLCWAVLEAEIKARLDRRLDEEGIDGAVEGFVSRHLNKPGQRLKLASELIKEVGQWESAIAQIKSQRDVVAHGDHRADQETSAEALEVAYELVKPTVEDALAGEKVVGELEIPPGWLRESPSL